MDETFPKFHRFLPGDIVHLASEPHSQYTVESFIVDDGLAKYRCRSEFGLIRNFFRSHLMMNAKRDAGAIEIGELVLWQRHGISETSAVDLALTYEPWSGIVEYVHSDIKGVRWVHVRCEGVENVKVVRYNDVMRFADYFKTLF